MPFQQLRANRNNYAYPAVALGGNFEGLNSIQYDSTTDLDNYIHNLLNAPTQNEQILGYLSVLESPEFLSRSDAENV